MDFKVKSNFNLIDAQEEAVNEIVTNRKSGKKYSLLLGVTGSGKTFVMANIIARLNKPTLIISPNKVLAAQLYQELKEFFPENSVHYFVSYYDYYQPEAYIPHTDTYIEKDAKINETIDRLRHEAVQSILTRKDTIVVASVSCIYNLGSPEDYQKVMLTITKGQAISRGKLFASLVNLQYQRNDFDFQPGCFRTRGEQIQVYSPTGKQIFYFTITKNKVEQISVGETPYDQPTPVESARIFPAKFWVSPESKLKIAIQNIRTEEAQAVLKLKKEKHPLEAERLQKRTDYDLELMEETGWCHSIENYSRHLEFRNAGDPPWTLLDYFKKADPDYNVFIDESHQTIPQIRAMSRGDLQRKMTLISYGFRLPSAIDNRPLNFAEFSKAIPDAIFLSATPGPFEIAQSQKFNSKTELLVRPTGLLEPTIEIRPTGNQIKDVIEEIERHAQEGYRTLLVTLTKRLAEDITQYLSDRGIKVAYIHSDVKTLDRPEILKKLREGAFQVLVGINLLREGLDLPEVALVAILDADKEGFLRNRTTLVQTMGRAARNINGHVILYADKKTQSIKDSIDEINHRREIQIAYNKSHGIKPKQIVKEIREWNFFKEKEEKGMFSESIEDLEREMKKAAKNLDFEKAADFRDQIESLKKLQKDQQKTTKQAHTDK